MKALASNRRARQSGGRAQATCSTSCCGCTAFYKALPCDNPSSATCRPLVCELYVCANSVCCDGSVPPTEIGPGSTILYQNWCYVVKPGTYTPGQVPGGAAILGTSDFCDRRAFCVPGNCSHPACQCPSGPWLYWQACPCPGGAGDTVCRVISLSDYADLAASLGSDCVVANAGGLAGCVYVSARSPRASTLPPSCSIFSPPATQITDTCCDCCPGCGSSRIAPGTCTTVRAINPKWSCLATACCCQRVHYRWSFKSNYRPGGNPGLFFNVSFSGEQVVDFTTNPSGVVVPVTVTINAWYGTETITRDMELICGAHRIVPPAMDYVPVQYAGVLRPVTDGQVSPAIFLTQTGEYGCAKYRSTAFATETPGGPPGDYEFEWKIEAISSPTSTCGRGCSGVYVRPADGPCGQPAGDIGEGGAFGLI